MHEALELRDGDPKRYAGKGVLKAVAHVTAEGVPFAVEYRIVRPVHDTHRALAELGVARVDVRSELERAAAAVRAVALEQLAAANLLAAWPARRAARLHAGQILRTE